MWSRSPNEPRPEHKIVVGIRGPGMNPEAPLQGSGPAASPRNWWRCSQEGEGPLEHRCGLPPGGRPPVNVAALRASRVAARLAGPHCGAARCGYTKMHLALLQSPVSGAVLGEPPKTRCSRTLKHPRLVEYRRPSQSMHQILRIVLALLKNDANSIPRRLRGPSPPSLTQPWTAAPARTAATPGGSVLRPALHKLSTASPARGQGSVLRPALLDARLHQLRLRAV